mgnify:CR=1 FL=1
MRNPFIAGSWVRGDNFFGRANLLREILEGSRDSLWVIGARRMGKTSLLKEVEARTQASKETPYLALYWDLQGSADARGLADGLIASIEDNEHFRRADLAAHQARLRFGKRRVEAALKTDHAGHAGGLDGGGLAVWPRHRPRP